MKKWTGGGGRPAQGVHGRCRSSQPPQDGAGLSNYTYSTARRGVAVGGGGRRRRRRRKYSAVLQIRPKEGKVLARTLKFSLRSRIQSRVKEKREKSWRRKEGAGERK